MRKQIAAANWKMNLNLSQASELIQLIKAESFDLHNEHQVVLAVPAPYLQLAVQAFNGK